MSTLTFIRAPLARTRIPFAHIALVIEGLGTGVAGPTALATALRAVLPADAGAAGAGTSAASQLGASIGAALLNTIAVAATTSFLAVHHTASSATATVHGFTVAMIWGAAILLVAAVPTAIFINAKAPARRR